MVRRAILEELNVNIILFENAKYEVYTVEHSMYTLQHVLYTLKHISYT